MKLIDNVKLKKEIKKLKKENKELKMYNDALKNQVLIHDKQYYFIPEKMFEELWECQIHKPIEIIYYDKEAILYKEKTYILEEKGVK